MIYREILEKIFYNFDFGYDVQLVDSDNWVCKEKNIYIKHVFLEFIDTPFSIPHPALLQVVFKNNSLTPHSIDCVLLNKPLKIGSSSLLYEIKKNKIIE